MVKINMNLIVQQIFYLAFLIFFLPYTSMLLILTKQDDLEWCKTKQLAQVDL